MQSRNSQATAPPPAPEVVIQRALVLAFPHDGHRSTQRRAIPRGGLLLGRGAPFFDVPFDDEGMSAQHAEIRTEGGVTVVRDLGSEAGTGLNGQPLRGTHALEQGDVLRMSDTLLVYARSESGEGEDELSTIAEPELTGSSPSIAAVRRSIDAVAPHKRTVVITGETGTGKEIVARQIHRRSGRPGPFVAVNCGAFTEGLLASELFGHVRGAFTGAVQEQQGLFRSARGGTLLLDDAAEIPLSLQPTLLRVLETWQVRPVGSTRDVDVDVRVIATTNRELLAMVQEGLFRSDLYARLAQWNIRLPPLRERREDIPELTAALLARCEAAGRSLTPDLQEALLLHDWPMNVRWLFNVLSVAAIVTPAGALALGDEVREALRKDLPEGAAPPRPEAQATDKASLESLLGRFQGRVAEMARHLGITRPKLYRLLWAEGLDPAPFRARKGARVTPAPVTGGG
jgi:DNA-binding NtrC family response regulator